MPTLRDLIDDGAVHVADGAMGTMLYQKGVFLNVCFDELVVRQPDVLDEPADVVGGLRCAAPGSRAVAAAAGVCASGI